MTPPTSLGDAWRAMVHAVGRVLWPAPAEQKIFNPRAWLAGTEGYGVNSLTRPYANSVWVQRAIKTVVEPLGAVSLRFSADRRGGDVIIDDPALADWWSRPAVGMSQSEFVEAIGSWYKLEGEFFLILDDSWAPGRMMARNPVIVARPDRMRHIVRGGLLEAWEYTDAAGQRHVRLPGEVVHVRAWNPYDDWRGQGEWQAAQPAAESDFLAGKYVRNVMAASGDQGVYVIAKNGVVDDSQREQLTRAIREKRERGLRGDPRPIFLTGDIAIEDARVTTPDADFVSVRLQNRHEVAIAFGVPASMFDVVASYSVGAASDRYRLIEDTCMPLGAKICDGIEVVARRWYRGVMPNIYAWLNWAEHSVVQYARRERLKEADGLWTKGMPMRVVSEYLDLRLPRYTGDEVGYLPFSVAPVAQLSVSMETSEEYAEPVEEPAETGESNPQMTQMAADVSAAMAALKQRPAESRAEPEPEEDPRRAALWRSHMAARRETTRAYTSKLSKLLIQARAETLRNLRAHDKALGKEGEDKPPAGIAADITFSLTRFLGDLVIEFRKVARAAMERAGQALYTEIGRDDPWSMPPARALQFLGQRENLLRDASQEIWEDVRGAVEEGFTAGDSTAQIATRVRTAFAGIAKGRSQTIAITETSAAYGTARHEAMRSAGVKYKQWLTSHNDNVRATHRAAEGQTVAVDDPFRVGGVDLMFPGDPSGPPREIINCHCVQIAVEGSSEQGAGSRAERGAGSKVQGSGQSAKRSRYERDDETRAADRGARAG